MEKQKMNGLQITAFIVVMIVIVIAIAQARSKAHELGNTLTVSTSTSSVNNQPVNSVVYACNDNKNITADYYQGQTIPAVGNQPPIPGGSVKLSLGDGRAMTLAQTISADGTRYANTDETFVFWSKGNGALVLENNKEKTYIGCILLAPKPDGVAGESLNSSYSDGEKGFSIRLSDGYTIDRKYAYQVSPNKKIYGVKFTIPKSLTTGTNLGSDTYISVEQLFSKVQQGICSAEGFLDGTHKAVAQTIDGVEYSVATSSGAGAGNRYEETVYAIPGSNSCIGIRYFVHYGVIQNYPEGTTKEFDSQTLRDQFDAIRSTLVSN